MLKTYLMMSSAVKTCVMLLAIVLLAACGSTPKQSGTATTNEYSDAEYNNKVTKFINNPEAGKVEPLFKAYVNSTIPDNIWDIRNDFDALQARINNGESCANQDWDRIIRQNIMRLPRHIAAIECYQVLGDETSAQKHIEVFQALIEGISLNKTGDDYVVAYEVLVEEDAEEFLTFAGYDIVAMEYELVEGDDGIYIVYTVKNQETGLQETIYFDHRRFIHRIYDVDYPFSAKDAIFTNRFLPEMSAYNKAAYAGLGDGYIVNWGDIDGATEEYWKGVAWTHAPAMHKLAEACLNYSINNLERIDCVNLLVDAAEENYLQSVITLAYLYHEGVVVEQDQALAQALISSVSQHMQAGAAEWAFFKLVVTKPFTEEHFVLNPHQSEIESQLTTRFGSTAEAEPYLSLLSAAINAGSEPATIFKNYYLPTVIDNKLGPLGLTELPASNEAVAWVTKSYLAMLFMLGDMDEAEILRLEDDFEALQLEYNALIKKNKRLFQQPNFGVFKGLAVSEMAEDSTILSIGEYGLYVISASKHNLVGKALLVDWLHNNADSFMIRAVVDSMGSYNQWLSNCLYHNMTLCVYTNAKDKANNLSALPSDKREEALTNVVNSLLTIVGDADALALLKQLANKYPQVKAIVISQGKTDIAELL